MAEWIKSKFTGVRYRLHKTRKHGVKFDQYFSIRYRVDGKHKEEGLGWASEGWSERKAAATLATLKANQTTGTGPKTLQESREIRKQQEQAEAERVALKKAEQDKHEALIFENVFSQYCESSAHKKSLKDEMGYYRNWIGPAIGKKRLDQIVLLDLERIRKRMTNADKAPRSIQYVKNIVRQTYHFAIAHKIYNGEIPTLHFLRKMKIDNKRQRYFTPTEAGLLLDEVRSHSESTYQVSLLSLNSGMRFGEIAALRWQHINTGNREIIAMGKDDESRSVFMTAAVLDMFNSMKFGKPNELVFPARYCRKEKLAKEHDGSNHKMSAISNVFDRAVKKLGFNEGITDRRMRVVFHTLRHSCASWLVNSGVGLPVIAKILGHKTLAMTMRYSHVNDRSVISAMALLDEHQETDHSKKIVKMRQV